MAGPPWGVAQPQVEIERRATRQLGSQATVARGDDLVAETTRYGDDLPGDGSCGHSAAWADAGGEEPHMHSLGLGRTAAR
jgi:hypothetical protein